MGVTLPVMSERLYLGPVYRGPIHATVQTRPPGGWVATRWWLAVWPATTVEPDPEPRPVLGEGGWETMLAQAQAQAQAQAPVVRVLAAQHLVDEVTAMVAVVSEAGRSDGGARTACGILDRVEMEGAPAAIVYGASVNPANWTVLQSFGPVTDQDVDRFLRVIALG